MKRQDPFKNLNQSTDSTQFDSLDKDFDDPRITDEMETTKSDEADFKKTIMQILSRPDEKKNDDKSGYKSPPKHSQFKKGGKAGPGRPKGAKSNTTLIKEAIEQQTEKYGPSVIESLFYEARTGHIQAIKIVLAMVVPKLNNRVSVKNGKVPVFSRLFNFGKSRLLER